MHAPSSALVLRQRSQASAVIVCGARACPRPGAEVALAAAPLGSADGRVGQRVPPLASASARAVPLAAAPLAAASARLALRRRRPRPRRTALHAASTRSSLLRGVAGVSVPLSLADAANAVDAVDLLDLRGRTAVVTGATKGIGKGIAIGLGEAHATVFVTGRDRARIEATADLVTRAGGRGIGLVCDHAVDAQVAQAFQEVARQTDGTLDLLVNNAFQAPGADPETDRLLTAGAKFYDLPIQVWDDMHNVGLRSHYVSTYYAAPLLLRAAQAGGGRRPLVCVTSSFGGVSFLLTAAYGVGKAASDRLVRDLQVELGPQGIDCVSLYPGLVLTETVKELVRTSPQRISRMTGDQDVSLVAESPLLTGRIAARLSAFERLRKPPYTTPDGLTGRICIVAEAARDLGVRDGGPAGTVARELYGEDRAAAPSIRSLGFLGPGLLRSSLPDALKGLAAPGGPLANDGIRMTLEFMAQGPPKS